MFILQNSTQVRNAKQLNRIFLRISMHETFSGPKNFTTLQLLLRYNIIVMIKRNKTIPPDVKRNKSNLLAIISPNKAINVKEKISIILSHNTTKLRSILLLLFLVRTITFKKSPAFDGRKQLYIIALHTAFKHILNVY